MICCENVTDITFLFLVLYELLAKMKIKEVRYKFRGKKKRHQRGRNLQLISLVPQKCNLLGKQLLQYLIYSKRKYK